MKITYLFPFALFMLLLALMIELPDLRHCALPSEIGASGRADGKDILIVCAISLAYAVVAFIGLGSDSAPQSFVLMNAKTLEFELSGEEYPSKIMYYSGVGSGRYRIDFSVDGASWEGNEEFTQEYADVLKWNESFPTAKTLPKYVRISGIGEEYLGEIAMFNGDGERITLAPCGDDLALSALLLDEPDTVVTKADYLNSSYFDEIYHARTAWEYMNTIRPYETSHPPLGKLIISLGVRLFGMTPFGWRFMGTLFGVLMLPLMYLFIQKLFGGHIVPTVCTIVFASDFMHYVQTRIATIDTYGVFFTLLMYFFMYLFIEEEENAHSRRSLLYLALSGVSFGLGAASKWTGFYAGAGLAVIWALFWVFHRERGFAAFAKNALFCLVFFVLVPALIYYVSYYDHVASYGIEGIGAFFKKEYFRLVWENQELMFSYHSGLSATHPYSSNWYQWILDIRPILYYLEYFDDGTRSSFGAFVNPALCWGGLLSLFVLLFMAIRRHDRTALFLLIAYFAQLVPWMFITRVTFEYHYFPCTIFLITALGYVFKLITDSNRFHKIYLGGFALVSILLFVLFYPALSGKPVDNAMASKLFGWLPTWPL